MSYEITEKELLVAAQIHNIPPADMSLYVTPKTLVEYQETGEAGYDAALVALTQKGLVTIQKGRLKPEPSFSNYVRSHKKPDLLIDYIHTDNEKTKTTSFLRKKASIYSIARQKDGKMLVIELGENKTVQDIIVEDLGEISSTEDPYVLTLDYKEFLALSAIINMSEYDQQEVIGQTAFTVKEISGWIKKGSHMGYVAGLLYFGEKQRVKSALKSRKEILSVLGSLVSIRVLRELDGTYRLRDEFLPLVFTLASPQKTGIISAINKPFTRTASIWECILMKYGKHTVLMEFSDVSDLEITITTIPESKQLTEYLTTLIEVEIPHTVHESPEPKKVPEVPPPPPTSQTSPTPQIRFCTNCGAELKQDYKYCPECRNRVR